MRLLMHICCANCALYPVRRLEERGIAFRGLWFNPNIHPEEEYLRRREAVRTLEGLWRLGVDYAGDYGIEEFKSSVDAHKGVRCGACYAMRLGETARRAKEQGYDGFTTSLLVSPYQRHGLIVETGKHLETEFDVEFFAEDMRAGWAEAGRLSRRLGLYRQYYCGCIYSKEERDAEREAKKRARAEAPA